MATIVLTALGTVIGGPLGGAVGSLLGRQIDGAVFGGPRSEGPRLKELAVTTSSYGQPIARHYGRVRAAGTIIWATDLKETKEKSGGGKGQPSTTTYSYSVSFAVALASRPIDGIGRIWADGNLLRGEAGDLKSAGSLRIHTGLADQLADPLLASALGDKCPAHRGCAYAVFEDLALADFGNRIPALTFEIMSGRGDDLLPDMLDGMGSADDAARLEALQGYTHDGGSIAAVLSQLDRFKPIVATYTSGGLRVTPLKPHAVGAPLPEAVVWSEGDFGRAAGQSRSRRAPPGDPVTSLRYYDPDRDYQPGLQRAGGGEGSWKGATLEFPGVLEASDARSLLVKAASRQAVGQETLSWRIAELDPTLAPGRIVKLPGTVGQWLVTGWEWREAGVELHLVRHLEQPQVRGNTADPGEGWHPPDRSVGETGLRVFELPWDGTGSSETSRIYAAVTAPAGPWPGAALYARNGATLEPIGPSGPARAITGHLLQPLAGSTAMRFEGASTVRLKLIDTGAVLESRNVEALARGANRLLVGGEIIQFARATPLGGGEWKLSGLLRGRGGTELEATAGHPVATAATLLDDGLIRLPTDLPAIAGQEGFAAIGLADAEPVMATLENAGISRRPLSPCHGAIEVDVDDAVKLSWVRRSRGGWIWRDEVEQPLVEQNELYELGLGPPPFPLWLAQTTVPCLILDRPTISNLHCRFADQPIWVRQAGNYGKSPALLLGNLGQFD